MLVIVLSISASVGFGLSLSSAATAMIIPAPTALTGTEQDLIATPSMWTVQAPHWAMPQPYLVPVRPSVSRSTHSSGVSGSTSTCCGCSLMVRRSIGVLLDRGPDRRLGRWLL